MSVQNLLSILMNQPAAGRRSITPVLFYFWSERLTLSAINASAGKSWLPSTTVGFILAKLDCDAEQMIAAQFWSARHPDGLSVSEMANRSMVFGDRSRKRRSALCRFGQSTAVKKVKAQQACS